MPFESTSEHRKYIRYQAELPATFTGDHEGAGIIYNLGIGGCKMVSDCAVKSGDLLSMQLKIPGQAEAIIIRATSVQWTMELEFGVEFLEIQELERTRLERFLATQMNIAT
jgi:hypothetical protein